MKEMRIKKVLFSEEEIAGIVSSVADKINRDLCGSDELVLLCVLKGAAVFTADLMRRLNAPKIRLEFIKASSYGMSDISSGCVKINGADVDISGADVIVIEDIIDTGNTLSRIKAELESRSPKSLKFCGLFDKPSRRQTDFEADYIGRTIPDEFIVGYGLDYAELYRALPYVAVLEEVI